jgi:hypothetical protein
MCDPSILNGRRCATGEPICERHREELGLTPLSPRAPSARGRAENEKASAR